MQKRYQSCIIVESFYIFLNILMKKCLIWTILWTLSLCIVVPTNAFTESEVTDKVEQLEKVIKATLKKPWNRSKYSPLFKSTFESCAKTCKDEVNKEASLRLGKKYYSNFLEGNTPIVKSDREIENTATTNDIQKGENHKDAIVNTLSEEKTHNWKCWNDLSWPVWISIKPGETKKMRYALYGIADYVNWSVYNESSPFDKKHDELVNRNSNKIHFWATSSDKNTYFIEISVDEDIEPATYLIKAETECSWNTYELSVN